MRNKHHDSHYDGREPTARPDGPSAAGLINTSMLMIVTPVTVSTKLSRGFTRPGSTIGYRSTPPTGYLLE